MNSLKIKLNDVFQALGMDEVPDHSSYEDHTEKALDKINKLKSENDDFKDICVEYLDGTDDTAKPECLHAAVEEWTDEIVELKEDLNKFHDKIGEVFGELSQLDTEIDKARNK